MRVCDFGRVSARRSQTLWHAVAEGVSAGAPPTLSFMRPTRPYVGIGYHRPASEVDLVWCRQAGLPVYRRMVGGGVVYLDADQQFFQICLPLASVSPGREAALRELLAPAVAAFRAAGVDAALDEAGEISVGGAKICGHGAAQIGTAVVVVGNLIERFDHGAAARVLALPDEARTEVVRLMRRYVTPTPADPDRFRVAAVAAYAEALGLEPERGRLDAIERGALIRLDRRFATRRWLDGPVGERPRPAARAVKLRAGVFVVIGEGGGARLVASVVDHHVEGAQLQAPGWNGQAGQLARSLVGLEFGEVRQRLETVGGPGAALAHALGGLRLAA